MPEDGKLVVLLVDDDPGDRELIRYGFDSAAPEVRLMQSRGGEEAISYLRGDGPFADRAAHPLPDVVLLDINMPRVSGFDVLRWARSRPELAGIKLVMLTSSSETRDVEAAYSLGANSFLVKTASLDTMAALIRGVATLAALR